MINVNYPEVRIRRYSDIKRAKAFFEENMNALSSVVPEYKASSVYNTVEDEGLIAKQIMHIKEKKEDELSALDKHLLESHPFVSYNSKTINPDNINISKHTYKILSIINKAGYEANVVGGCIRDMCLGITPMDEDISTNMPVNKIVSVFSKIEGFSVYKTGVKHNTVTIKVEGSPSSFEITRYRNFKNTFKGDLVHRDFTINSLAYNPIDGFIDKCGGLNDLKKNILRSINPEFSMKEDPLRMLRAIRFISQYGFELDPKLKASINGNAALLIDIPKERIMSELCKIIMGPHVTKALYTMYKLNLMKYTLPFLHNCFSFKQNGEYNEGSVGEHTLKVIENTPPDLELRLAALFHDIGKLKIYHTDENGIYHFNVDNINSIKDESTKELVRHTRFYDALSREADKYVLKTYNAYSITKVEEYINSVRISHSVMSQILAFDIMKTLRFSNKIIKNVVSLIGVHSVKLDTTEESVGEFILSHPDFSDEMFYKFISLRIADIYGHSDKSVKYALPKYTEVYKILKNLLETRPHNVSSLTISKDEILNISDNGYISIPSFDKEEIGAIRSIVLKEVFFGRVKNSPRDICEYLKDNALSIQADLRCYNDCAVDENTLLSYKCRMIKTDIHKDFCKFPFNDFLNKDIVAIEAWKLLHSKLEALEH